MSLYRRFPGNNLPSFITTNASERRRVFTDAPTCDLLVRIIYEVRSETQFRLLAFSIMPDHLHLILSLAESGLGKAVQLIKGRFARTHNQKVGSSGSVWQSRYHERALRSEAALFSAIEYVHENPVAAQLVSEAADYPWSTASGRYETDFLRYLGQAEA